MNETNFKAIDDMIDSFKELYGENEPADYKAVITLTNEQMGMIINTLTIAKNTYHALDGMTEDAQKLTAKGEKELTREDVLELTMYAYALDLLEMIVIGGKGSEVDG